MKEMRVIKKEIEFGDGRKIEIETGKLAKKADGSVVVRMGNAMVLATVVSSRERKEDCDFLPLSCDYREKYSANGRFPGGFFKREARPSNHEILICRLIDRAIRPLFPKDYHYETVLTVELISADKNVVPETLAGLAAAAALAVSDIPFAGPMSEAVVARVDGQLVIAPTFDQLERSDLKIVVGATKGSVLMVEGEMNEVTEDDAISAILCGFTHIQEQCRVLTDLRVETGGRTRSYESVTLESVDTTYLATFYNRVREIMRESSGTSEKSRKIESAFPSTLGGEVLSPSLKAAMSKIKRDAIRDAISQDGVRFDGRGIRDVRPIWSEVDYLPTAHGSAIFTRGGTQALATVTLGSKTDEQLIDGVIVRGYDKFMLHYNFPSYCTGEARAQRSTSRREIGHGNLAKRAIAAVLPEDFPYTIRVTSDILESNGSSSMATVCAGCLALMDAGVPIRKPVSGVAMGLIYKDGVGTILTDILGSEDHIGDMDFKVAGTADGINALQMDIKIDGLDPELLRSALGQAREARLHILGEMAKTMTESNLDLKPHVPRLVTLIIPKSKIGALIGPGGKNIRELQETTGAVISVDEDGDHGIVEVTAEDKEAADAVVRMIQSQLGLDGSEPTLGSRTPRPTRPEPKVTETFDIPKSRIGALIGPRGKTIHDLQDSTGASITVEEESGKGIVTVGAEDADSLAAAIREIRKVTFEPTVGEIYIGKVKNIQQFGAFVEIAPGRDGLLHISEIAWNRVNRVEDYLQLGDAVEVKLVDMDESGRLRLSRKVLLPKPGSR